MISLSSASLSPSASDSSPSSKSSALSSAITAFAGKLISGGQGLTSTAAGGLRSGWRLAKMACCSSNISCEIGGAFAWLPLGLVSFCSSDGSCCVANGFLEALEGNGGGKTMGTASAAAGAAGAEGAGIGGQALPDGHAAVAAGPGRKGFAALLLPKALGP